jgi:hypothetical protein
MVEFRKRWKITIFHHQRQTLGGLVWHSRVVSYGINAANLESMCRERNEFLSTSSRSELFVFERGFG